MPSQDWVVFDTQTAFIHLNASMSEGMLSLPESVGMWSLPESMIHPTCSAQTCAPVAKCTYPPVIIPQLVKYGQNSWEIGQI